MSNFDAFFCLIALTHQLFGKMQTRKIVNWKKIYILNSDNLNLRTLSSCDLIDLKLNIVWNRFRIIVNQLFWSELSHRTNLSRRYQTNSDNKFDSEFKFDQKWIKFNQKWSHSIKNGLVEFNQKCPNQSKIQSFSTIFDQVWYIFDQIWFNDQHKDNHFQSFNRI